jgi:hypothetical protein
MREAGSKRRRSAGQRLAIYIPAPLVERLRVRCAKEGRSLSDAVTCAVKKWMNARG